MRRFYRLWPIPQTLSGESKPLQSKAQELFSLPWSHYVRLLAIDKQDARAFYEQEAIRGGWSIRQLDRQIGSRFYERTLLSRNKTAMLTKGQRSEAGDKISPEEEIKDPYVLEFLHLKDEYSESDLEDALIHRLVLSRVSFASWKEYRNRRCIDGRGSMEQESIVSLWDCRSKECRWYEG